jgi:phosphate transport system protein
LPQTGPSISCSTASRSTPSTIARRQPLAVDLREIVSAIRVANDLERIGDLAKNIAKRVVAIGHAPVKLDIVASLSPLASRVGDQVKVVAGAYRDRNDAAAIDVWKSDGEVDTLHTSLFRELLTYMMEDPRSIGTCTHLLFCAKNLERIGDHATNIAEIVHYMTTGGVLATDRPKADESSCVDPNLEPNKT